MFKVDRMVGDLMLTTDLIKGMDLVRVAVFRQRIVGKLSGLPRKSVPPASRDRRSSKVSIKQDVTSSIC